MSKRTKQERLLHNAQVQRRRLRIIDGLNEWIQQTKCVDCGLDFKHYLFLAMFHHETERVGNSKGLKSHASSIKRLFTELNKGVFLCPNCHVTRHHIEDLYKAINRT